MRVEILILALIVGAFTYSFRYLPMRINLMAIKPGGPLSRFLSSTGPAAIATLFVASILPALQSSLSGHAPLTFGIVAVLAAFAVTRSVVGATLAGALAYGAIFALI